jgi:hypothetical protein
VDAKGTRLVHWTKHRAAYTAIAVAVAGCGRVANDSTNNAAPHPGGVGADGSVGMTNTFVDTISQHNVDKLDLLFMIQNSRSMADMQEVLKDAVPDLMLRLVSPNCMAPGGMPDRASMFADPSEPCPVGDSREFIPIRSIHVGVITSSLGGSAACQGADGAGIEQEEADDHGHLVATRPRFAAVMQPNSGGQPPDPGGFLDWNPDVNMGEQVAPFVTTFRAMTIGAGELGCDVPSQLESIYRFLVDPAPPLSIATQPCPGSSQPCAVPVGIDSALLAQRKAFLRPDSLVAVVLIGDGNDRSIREPGTDLLYPTQRYVNALSQPRICTSRPDLDPDPSSCPDLDGDHQPDVVANPLFQDPEGQSGVLRSSSLVYLAGIVGVPRQDIQAVADSNGNPYSAVELDAELHYKSAQELTADHTWATILGTEHPTNNGPPILPTDALMVESTTPRVGFDGETPPKPLAAPNAGYLANPVNGHERGNTGQSAVEYACIFHTPASRDCALVAQLPGPPQGCDCKTLVPGDNNPLCQTPAGAFTTTQAFAKAYPGLRELTVLRDLGDNAIVASICARNLIDPMAQDYGYRAALDAIVERLKDGLTGRCLPVPLRPVPDPKHAGKIVVPCTVTEARPNPLGSLGCDPNRGRTDLDPKEVAPALAELKAKGVCDVGGSPPCSSYSVCQLQEAGTGCHTDENATAPSAPGWCYVDPANNPNDNPTLVEKCPKDQPRMLRFVDPENATPANDATVIIRCSGAE